MSYINKLSKYSELLNKVEVRKITTLLLDGYIPDSIRPQSDGEIVCRLINDK